MKKLFKEIMGMVGIMTFGFVWFGLYKLMAGTNYYSITSFLVSFVIMFFVAFGITLID